MRRALVTTLIAACALASPVTAAEIAVRCNGESIDFKVLKGSPGTYERDPLPEQIFIFDEAQQKGWRWLAAKEERDPFCGGADCQKTFTPRSIDFFWFVPSKSFVSSVRFDLDRATGHAVYELKMQSPDHLLVDVWDMQCERTSLPKADSKKRI